MRVHLKSLGCRLNEAELETWGREFQAAGHQITGQADDADLLVVNTCAVTGEAVRKSRQIIRRVHRHNPTAKLAVSGCYASLEPGQTADIPGVDLVVDNQDKQRLVEISLRDLDLSAMPSLASEPSENPLFARGRHRAFVKVQDGCRYRCSFCIVTVARGEERSRCIDEVVDEVNALVNQGVREAVLTGVHLGGYGSDRGTDLRSLIEAVLERTGIARLRLGSLEPWDLPERLFGLFDDPRLMPHLHLPLQSGADSVLRRMARRCRTGDFERLVATARERIPDLNVTTDIIVGFPGESEEEWRQTLSFVERTGFSHLHIFAYSPRAGTKAARLPDQVPAAVKRARSQELHTVGRRLKRAVLDDRIGNQFQVLIEGHGKPGDDGRVRYWGYTPDFLRVEVAVGAETAPSNTLLRVRAVDVLDSGDGLLGEPLN